MAVLTTRAREVFAQQNADGTLKRPGEHADVWGTEMEAWIEAAAEGLTVKATWAELSAITGTRDGQAGRVTGADAGTHTDPVVGGTVANVGEYAWDTSPAGWQRVGDLNQVTTDGGVDIQTNSSTRTLDLSGDVTTASDFATSGAFAMTLTATGATNVTLPTSGTLATTAGAETLTNKTLTAPVIAGGTADALTSLSVRSTAAAFDLKLASAEAITSPRTLTIDVQNADRTITLGGPLTLDSWFQTVGDFAIVLNATAATDITLPISGTLTTEAQVTRTRDNAARRLMPDLRSSTGTLIGSLMGRVAELERALMSALLAVSTTIYCAPAAAGTGDGSSFANAMAPAAAIAAVPMGGKLKMLSTQGAPFIRAAPSTAVIEATDLPDYVDVEWLPGTWIDCRLFGSWTDEGGGVWSLGSVTEAPKAVAFNLTQDDEAGTATGCDLTAANKAAAIRQRNRDADKLRVWIGMMVEAETPSTTPAEGEWSYDAGTDTIYANPPGAPDQATVDAQLCWYDGATAFHIGGTAGTTKKIGQRFHGDLTCFFMPATGGKLGYAFHHESAENCSVEGVTGYMCGDHAIGFTHGAWTGNAMRRCTIVQMIPGQNASGTTFPFIFHKNHASIDASNAGHVGDDLVYIAAPLFDGSGVPTDTKFSACAFYSHTNGTGTIGNVNWFRGLQIDFNAEINAKHSMTLTEFYSFATAADNPDTMDPADPTTWSCHIHDSMAIGQCAWFDTGIALHNCIIDRSGTGDSTATLKNILTPDFRVVAYGGAVATGEMRHGFANIATGDLLGFFGTYFLMQMTDASYSGLFMTLDAYSDLIILQDCLFEADNAEPAILSINGATPYGTGGINIIDNRGGNLLGELLAKPVRQNGTANSRDVAWWLANTSNGDRDSVADVAGMAVFG